MKKRMICVLLAAVLLLSIAPAVSFAEEPEVLVSHGIASISDRGNVLLNLTSDQIFEKFAYGDIVTVSMGTLRVDMPLVDGYCIDVGSPAVYPYRRNGKEEIRLVVNMGEFATRYEIAYRPDPKEHPTEWVYCDGFSADMDVTLSMKEKAGYLEEYQIRSMVYTDAREDYPNLTDAEFANFRMVQAGTIAPGVLYRSATPIDPKHNRNTYSDAAAKEAGVTVFINLVDTEDAERQLGGFPNSYYSGQTRICLAATVDFSKPENQRKLADGLRFMAEHPGVYDVFCAEGKDRTGLFLVILEGLMGATAEEIEQDYVRSFYNYYGITEDSKAYPYLVNGNLVKLMQTNLGAAPRDEDLQEKVEAYIKQLGLTEGEIARLKANLSGTEAAQPETTEETAAQPNGPEQQTREAMVQTQPGNSDYSLVSIAAALLLLAALCYLAWKRKCRMKKSLRDD